MNPFQLLRLSIYNLIRNCLPEQVLLTPTFSQNVTHNKNPGTNEIKLLAADVFMHKHFFLKLQFDLHNCCEHIFFF